MESRPSVRGLFTRSSYDQDAPEYTSVAAHEFEHDDDGEDEDDNSVLREEEEREKLLAGGGSIFGSIGRKIKIGKKVKGGRRRKEAGEVASMMGGKRLGMEAGGEFGIGSGSESEEEEEDYGMREKGMMMMGEKPRKPTVRKIILFSSLLLSFLVILISASIALSQGRQPPVAPQLVYTNGTHPYHKTTLLISIDGMRADFLYRNLTPTLDSFINSGVSPEYMLPSFPSVTFPNHWTLATGLTPEAHGIVGNSFFDPALGRDFFYTDPARSLQHEWWGGEPIWMTAEMQGLKAAVHMWPGSEAPGWGATIIDKFNGKEVLEKKVNRVLEWLDMPAATRPQFIAAYVPNVDEAGHVYGPNTTETDAAIQKVDRMLHDLFLGLEDRNLTEIVNIVIVSDHGMASTSKEKLIYIEDLVDLSVIERIDGWPLYGLRPKSHKSLVDIYNSIKAKEKKVSHWNVYLTAVDMPKRYQFSNNPRIAPLWIIPEAGWTIVTKEEFPPGTKGEYHPRGLHGFDNLHPLMHAMFVARGPAFRHLHGEGREYLAIGASKEDVNDTLTRGQVKAGRVAPFVNTEVYRLLCQSLGLRESISNATLSKLTLLSENDDSSASPDSSSNGDNDDETAISPTTTALPSSSSSSSSLAKSIGVQSPQPVPQRPTKIVDPNAPAVTEVVIANIGISAPAEPEGGGEGGGEGWWELLKSKAEKLRGKLEGWWERVWVEGEGGP